MTSNAAKSFDIIANSLNVLYFDNITFDNIFRSVYARYIAKFLDTSAKSFFPHR